MFLVIKAMFSRVLGFFGLDKLSMYFILGLIALLSIIVVYNSDTILSRFGFETTSSLKAKVAKLEEQNQQLTQANKQLKDDLDKLEKRKNDELKAMKKYYEDKMANYNKLNKVQKELKEKNTQLIKDLEEQRKKLAESCKLDAKEYYLYEAKTYDEISSNNYEAIVTYQGLKDAKDLTPASQEMTNNRKTFAIDYNELKNKINKPLGVLK
jgi:cell division protein FtsB